MPWDISKCNAILRDVISRHKSAGSNTYRLGSKSCYKSKNFLLISNDILNMKKIREKNYKVEDKKKRLLPALTHMRTCTYSYTHNPHLF